MRLDLRRGTVQSARLLLLSYLAAACSVSRYASGASLPVPGAAPIPHARVHLADGATVHDLQNVVVASDSVIGYAVFTGVRQAIPVASVTSIETREISTGQTLALAAGVIVGAALVLFGVLVYLVTHNNADF